ncbi:MAG TPA: hypothetical protein VJ256_00205, partial [Dehalococcoidia bacterium]|nr:hypothetical protein [Dehalococcoidia bacterium]
VDRIYRLGAGLLAVKEVEFLGQAQQGPFVERIRGLQQKLLEMVESKHRVERAGTVPERVKLLQGKVRKVLTDPRADISQEQKEELYDDMDTLFLVAQLYSYPGQYLRENPTVHRIAETIFKLEEDVLSKGNYPAPRQVHVRFGEPVGVKEFLEEGSFNSRTGVRAMTELLSESIQSMIESMPYALPADRTRKEAGSYADPR